MPPLSSESRQVLLSLARLAIVEAVVHGRIPEIPSYSGELCEPGAAFVTVHRRGKLRGCLGKIDGRLPLAETVVHSAIGAAMHDPRFQRITADEVQELRIEISVLSAFETIAAAEVRPGIHGLYVVRGESRGLLLPQVAAERNWNAERFLQETCGKAGLEKNAWRDAETRILAFTAQIFSESDGSLHDPFPAP